MSSAVKSTIGVSGAALFVVLATNAEPLFKGLQAGWIFLSAILDKSPLGLNTFVLSLTLATLVMWFLSKWIPEAVTPKGKYGRSFLIELVTLGVGIFAVYFQLQSMMGLLVGTVAGLFAPLTYKGGAGLCAWIADMFAKGE